MIRAEQVTLALYLLVALQGCDGDMRPKYQAVWQYAYDECIIQKGAQGDGRAITGYCWAVANHARDEFWRREK